ncbi:MAG TPA: ABC transporter permease [Bryobacteraceae bacterium]
MNPDDLRGEIDAHLHEKIDDLIESGIPEAEARLQALREFGNATRYAEASREVWRWAWLDRLCQDLRHSVRAMRRDPAFTTVVVLTLALGVGAVTAIFSVVNAVLIRPLPYPHPERLTWMAQYHQVFKQEAVSGPDFFDWRSQLHSFDAMLGYNDDHSNVVTGDDAFQVHTVTVTGDFWDVTGAHPALGRAFAPGESNVVVIAQSLFERRFGADPRTIGKIVSWGGRPVTIVGVMPRNFRFLFPLPEIVSEAGSPKDVEAYMPSGLSPANQTHATARTAVLRVVGRRRPGVSLAQARAELEALESRIADQYRYNPFYTLTTLHLNSAGEKLIENSRRPLLVLLAAVGFLLLIACANVANLILARGTARHREISIRAALGAGRGRVILQLLTESLLLGLAGGAGGMALARLMIALVARLGPADVPRLRDASLDARVFAFALAVSLLTGVLFGIGPALASSRSSLHDFLKESSRAMSATPAARRMRAALAGAEIAIALVLLAGAGLMVKSFWRMNQREPGFNPEKTLVLKLSTGGPSFGTTPAQIAHVQEALRLLEWAPGVEAAGVWNSPLLGLVAVEGVPRQNTVTTVQHTASSGYLRAIGLRITQGRWITDNEPEPVVVVNQSFARRVALTENPVGLRIGDKGRIVGVVADLRYSKLDADPDPEIYIPYRRSDSLRLVDLVVRTSGDPRARSSDLRKLVSSIDPAHPVYDEQILEQALSDSIAPRRFNMLLLEIFSGLATLLASVGIYGVMSYAVTQRTREMGVRMALGARQDQVVRMVVRKGAAIAVIGVVAGLGVALWLTRLMTALLYEVRPSDPATFALVSLALLSAALAACWIPARRAARVNPVEALRYE